MPTDIAGWINVVTTIAIVPLFLAWAVVAVSAIQIFSMLPRGQRMAGYNDLSMWRFGKLRERIGPAADPHFKRMKLAGIVFALSILALLLLIALSIPFSGGTPTAETAALVEPINGVSHA